MFISVARGLVLVFRIPLLALIAAGAVLVCAATCADDWLKSHRLGLVRTQSSSIPLAWRAGKSVASCKVASCSGCTRLIPLNRARVLGRSCERRSRHV